MEGISIQELERWAEKRRKKMLTTLSTIDYKDKNTTYFSSWMRVYSDLRLMMMDSESDIIPFSSSVFVWEDIESLIHLHTGKEMIK